MSKSDNSKQKGFTQHHFFVQKSGAGFTLIEALVYIALLAVIIGGSLAVTNQLMESSGRDSARLMTQAEVDFVTHKIDWVLTGAKQSDVTAGATLDVTNGASHYCFSLASSKIMFKESSCSIGTAVPLTSSNVSVTSLSFTKSGSAVTTVLTINGETSTSTKYLQ